MGWGLDSSFFFPEKLQEARAAAWLANPALTHLAGGDCCCSVGCLQCVFWQQCRLPPSGARAFLSCRLPQVEQQVLPLSVCQSEWGTPDPPWANSEGEQQVQAVCFEAACGLHCGVHRDRDVVPSPWAGWAGWAAPAIPDACPIPPHPFCLSCPPGRCATRFGPTQ